MQKMINMVNTIINDDCFNVLKNIKNGSIDMVLTDPPYGTTWNEWDKLLNFEKWWQEILRVTKDNAAIVIFSQMPFTCDMINSNRKLFRYEYIWEKEQGSGFLNANKMPLKIHENILVFYRTLPCYNPIKTQGKPYTATRTSNSTNYAKDTPIITTVSDGLRFPTDIIKVKREQNTKETHPTAKPVNLLEYLIKTYSNEGDVILDTFAGCCPTAIACLNTNRKYICIEQEQKYYNIGLKRIRNYQPVLLIH